MALASSMNEGFLGSSAASGLKPKDFAEFINADIEKFREKWPAIGASLGEFATYHADDKELGLALRTVEDAIAAAIEPLIDAGLDDDHRRLLAYAVVGMAEGASRRFMEQRTTGGGAVEEEVARLAQRMADLAWAGLRSVHAD